MGSRNHFNLPAQRGLWLGLALIFGTGLAQGQPPTVSFPGRVPVSIASPAGSLPIATSQLLLELGNSASVIFAGQVLAITPGSGFVEITFHVDHAVRSCTGGTTYVQPGTEWPIMHPIAINCGSFAYQCLPLPFQFCADDIARMVNWSATLAPTTLTASFTALGQPDSMRVVLQPASAGELVGDLEEFETRLIGADGDSPIANQTVIYSVVSGPFALLTYQTLTAFDQTCPTHGRCPAAAILNSQALAVVSALDGSVTITPLASPGSPTQTEIAISAGSTGFATLVLTSIRNPGRFCASPHHRASDNRYTGDW